MNFLRVFVSKAPNAREFHEENVQIRETAYV
jgi:hypothetical protein